MNILKLNDLHSRVLSEILKNVIECNGCICEQTSETKLLTKIATNLLNMIENQSSNESINDRMNKLELQIYTLDGNVQFMEHKELKDIHNLMSRNRDKIKKLGSLIDDLTVILNKHSICGDDNE